MSVMTRAPANAGDGNFYSLKSAGSFFRPSHALIGKAVAGDFLRPVDVAQVDQHRPLHYALEPVEIERAELLPLGDDHQRGSALRTVVGVLAKGDVADHRLGLLHALRIVG